jgi:membrane fusion protein (multidrug efflux system)
VEQLLARPRDEDVALAQNQLEEARAALTVAEKQLDQTDVRAPYAGTVGRKLLQVGDQAGPNAPIFTFIRQPELEVRVEIDESERSRVKKGQRASVSANGYPEPFEAEVKEFAGEIDSVKGTLEARLRPISPPPWLLPGQTVDVNLILSPEGERLLVPLTSVKVQGDSSHVLVAENGTLVLREIKVSSPSQEGYLVLDGLSEGEWVVRYPQGFEAGQKVRAKRMELE